jgi:hypothetical protein
MTAKAGMDTCWILKRNIPALSKTRTKRIRDTRRLMQRNCGRKGTTTRRQRATMLRFLTPPRTPGDLANAKS